MFTSKADPPPCSCSLFDGNFCSISAFGSLILKFALIFMNHIEKFWQFVRANASIRCFSQWNVNSFELAVYSHSSNAKLFLLLEICFFHPLKSRKYLFGKFFSLEFLLILNQDSYLSIRSKLVLQDCLSMCLGPPQPHKSRTSHNQNYWPRNEKKFTWEVKGFCWLNREL